MYKPPQNLYCALVALRFKLMEYMCEHELLIPRVKKGIAGAGEQ
jgi:hypothetical protein